MLNDVPPAARQPGEIGNPAVFAEARRLFPNYPVSEVLMDDAAALSGLVRFVKATPALARLGASQILQEERATVRRAAEAADFKHVTRDITLPQKET
jgi:hypothetical protein